LPETKNLLIIVNTGADKPYNQYAAYVVAFMAKQIAKIEKVTVFYGPQGVGITKKGTLAGFAISDELKKLIADQIEGLSPADLPDDLEKLARFEKDQLGVNIASCGTFHVVDGFAKSIDDTSKIEDFIMPVKLPQAAEALLGADRILYY
jgi:predicted peroxiredoxin